MLEVPILMSWMNRLYRYVLVTHLHNRHSELLTVDTESVQEDSLAENLLSVPCAKRCPDFSGWTTSSLFFVSFRWGWTDSCSLSRLDCTYRRQHFFRSQGACSGGSSGSVLHGDHRHDWVWMDGPSHRSPAWKMAQIIIPCAFSIMRACRSVFYWNAIVLSLIGVAGQQSDIQPWRPRGASLIYCHHRSMSCSLIPASLAYITCFE